MARAVADAGLTPAAARRTGAKIFFADEAHFRADADHVSGYGQALRGRWALKGEPTLVDSTSPRRGEKERHPVLDTGPAITRRCAWRPVRWR